MADGQHIESPSTSGAVAAAGGDARAVALSSAADELCCCSSCPSRLVMEYLPWLLSASAAASMEVLQARTELQPEQVLQLLEGEQAKWTRMCFLVLFPLPFPFPTSLSTSPFPFPFSTLFPCPPPPVLFSSLLPSPA
jgi:hypothetical protein